MAEPNYKKKLGECNFADIFTHLVRFQVITAASMKAVFWVVAPCSLVALMMEAASTSEKSVNFYQTTRRNNPEDSHLHTHSLTGLHLLYSPC
jgi:hypothetical protein